MFARVLAVVEDDQTAGTWDEEAEVPAWARRSDGVRRARLIGGCLLVAGMCVAALVALAGGNPLAQISGRGSTSPGDVQVAQLVEEGEEDVKMVEVPSDKLQFVVDTLKELKSETDDLKKELRKLRVGFLQCGEVTCHGSEKCCGDTLCCGPEATCCGELCCGHTDMCCTSELGSSICGAHGSDCKDGFVFAPGTLFLSSNTSSVSGLPGLPGPGDLPLLPVPGSPLLQRTATGRTVADRGAAALERPASDGMARSALASSGAVVEPGSVTAAASPGWMLVNQATTVQQQMQAMPRGDISPQLLMMPYAGAMPSMPEAPSPTTTEAPAPLALPRPTRGAQAPAPPALQRLTRGALPGASQPTVAGDPIDARLAPADSDWGVKWGGDDPSLRAMLATSTDAPEALVAPAAPEQEALQGVMPRHVAGLMPRHR